jgi:anti-anti-sigma factor
VGSVNAAEANPPTQGFARTIGAHAYSPDSSARADKSTLVLTGELTIADAATLHESLLAAFGAASAVRLDLTGVVYVDAAILQLVCAAQKSAAAHGGQIILQGVQDSVIQDARMLGLESVLLSKFNILRTVEAACQKQR